MLCLGPSYECNLYWGNTWPLEVIAWWFWKSNGVCKIVARTDGFRKIAFLRDIQWDLLVFGQIRIVVHIRELHLVLRIVVVIRLFPRVNYRWWPIVGGASRHSWQQGSINVIIKGCRIKRCPREDVNVEFDGWGVIRVMGLKLLSYHVWYFFLFELILSMCVWR